MRYAWVLNIFILSLLIVSVLAAESLKIEIKEWDVPGGSFPHDPAVAPDGSLWYTGMRSNTLGRLELSTGKIKEFPLKTPDSGPHGLIADREGNIWFTANYKGYIGKLNPQTAEVTEYSMPDPAARDPHTIVIDRKGILWFTVQGGNFVGRLDSRTGTVKLKQSPTPGSRPYGIALNSKQIPFFCELGTNKIGRINPDTMKITEYLLPKDARPRRLAITPDDMIYYTNFAQGRLGRLDTETGKVEEKPSPGGQKSRPYGIAATPDGTVWYSEFGVSPNTIVRYDPKTKSFKTWLIPSGGGVVRHMVATPKGEIYISCSGVDKVGIVKVSGK